MDKKVWSSCENHSCFFRGAQKRAISAVVATVLIILITVAGVGIIWVGVLPMINRGFEFSGLDGRVSVLSSGGYTVYDSSRGIASVQVKRDVDEGVMNRIKISFVVDGSRTNNNTGSTKHNTMVATSRTEYHRHC